VHPNPQRGISLYYGPTPSYERTEPASRSCSTRMLNYNDDPWGDARIRADRTNANGRSFLNPAMPAGTQDRATVIGRQASAYMRSPGALELSFPRLGKVRAVCASGCFNRTPLRAEGKEWKWAVLLVFSVANFRPTNGSPAQIVSLGRCDD